jgi:hypothetical protein
MKRKQINTQQVLTPEDKKYLRGVSNYLRSLGMIDGSIEVDIDSGYDFDSSDIDWENMTHFSNNYRAEIPAGLIAILVKIMNYIDEKSLFQMPDVENINYERVDFDIDTEKQEISVNHWWSYYDKGDSSSVEWDGEQGKEIFEEWEKDGVLDEMRVTPNDGILTVKYNGSGDSGYIESNFEENGDALPASIEDWCYSELEDNFGGWEINEGSDGEFVFDFNNMTITLNHTYNIDETTSDTIYKEDFS